MRSSSVSSRRRASSCAFTSVFDFLPSLSERSAVSCLRAANKCADFEAERAAAISSVEVLLDFLLKVLPLPLPALNQLATASDRQRASLLLEVMRQ
jgi:hypothetical protein